MNTAETVQNQNMRRYYRWHAAVYDLTRWAFLFGRKTIWEHLPTENRQLLMEVGCGTGYNLRHLARRHPGWQFAGIDISPDMLARASKTTASCSRRVQLFERPYGSGDYKLPEPPDIILFSYSLTMFNPGWEAAIEQAWRDLKPGGKIAVVDFHDSASFFFHWWMERHHVRTDGHLLPALEARFQPLFQAVKPTWNGWWRYFMFVGRK